MSTDERLALIEDLWVSLDDAERDMIQLSPEQQAEVDRRLESMEREGHQGVSPEELNELRAAEHAIGRSPMASSLAPCHPSVNRTAGAPIMNLRGLIFDLDGTLADTIPICIEAFQHALNTYCGPDLSRAEIESLFGPTEEGMLQRVLPDYSPIVLETYLAEYERLHTASTLPFPGITALLDALQSRGILLAVVTGKGPRSAEISCRALGISSYFTHIDAGSPNGVIKPAAIARVVDEWSLRPLEVAYVGDAPADIEAARSAEVVSVGAAWAPAAGHSLLHAARPDFLFQAVSDFASWVGDVTDPV